MQNIDALDSRDFYFNGHWLSEFSGEIAGQSGNAPLSVLPQLDIKSERVLGRHGEFVSGATYSPRTFSVPVLFNDIKKIRDIASWLQVLTPQDFYFKNDTVKAKCMINSVLDLQNYSYQGTVELRFICHNPFYKAVNDITYSIEKATSASTSTVGNVTTIKKTTLSTATSITNSGNKESFPKISVYGSGSITVSVNTNSFTIVLDNTGTDYVDIDTEFLTVYKGTANRISSMTLVGFPTLVAGTNTLSASGTCTKIVVQCRSEWI